MVELSTIHKNEHVSAALKKLAAERILSLPVIDDQGFPIGILSMKSAVHYFVCKKNSDATKQVHQILEEMMREKSRQWN